MQSFYKAVPPPRNRTLPTPDDGPPLLSRLQRLADDGPQGPARPANSAVQAGWICIGLGMLSAWWFPLGHGFFSLAIIMSIIAMATHQIQSGLVLLAASFAGMLICWVIFLAAFTAWIFGAAHQARTGVLPVAPVARPPAVGLTNTTSVPVPATLRSAPAFSGARTDATEKPVLWNELMLMLRSGYRDDQIIAAASRRPLAVSISPMQAEMLRTEGAGDKLIDYLQARRPYSSASSSAPARRPVAVATVPAIPPSGVISGVLHAEPVDYAARDRQIQSLKTQIDALDEQVRCVRTNPKDSRYWSYYYGPPNGVDQQKFDAYVKVLDQQRNDLRRQKWQLEGR